MKAAFGAFAVLICLSARAFAGGDVMSGEDLRATVSGKTIQGSMKASGDYTEYYAPDGTLKGGSYTGTWRINEQDQLCVTYNPADPESCWHGRMDGNSISWVRGGQEEGRGAISDGDAGGFRGGDHGRR